MRLVPGLVGTRPLPVVSVGGGGGGSDWLGGILGDPIVDAVIASDGDNFDMDVSGHDGINLTASFKIRGAGSGSGHDTTVIALNGDADDSHYDFAFINVSGNGFPNNYRGWFYIPNDDVDGDIWDMGGFDINSYTDAVAHDMSAWAMGLAKGAGDLAFVTNRLFVAAAIARIQIIGSSGLQAGSRCTIWEW